MNEESIKEIAEEFSVKISSPGNGLFQFDRGTMRVKAYVSQNEIAGSDRNDDINAELFELDDESRPWLICRYRALNLRYAVLFGTAIFFNKGQIEGLAGTIKQ